MTLFNIDDILQESWFLITIFAVAALLCVIILTWIFVMMYHHSCKRQIQELDNHYNTLHKSFSTDCSQMISRIQTISNNNANYVSLYDACEKRFLGIMNSNDKSCFIAISSLKTLIGNKDYRNIKSVIDSTRQSMNDYSKAAQDLSNDLQTKLQKEDDFHSRVVPIKEKFRRLKDEYENNSGVLVSISQSFNTLFDHITSMFNSFEESLLRADYDGASKELQDMEKLIDASIAVMKDLPYLNTLASKVIPGKIAELNSTYLDLEKRKYPLHNLRINSNIEKMNQQLSECNERLLQLSTKGVNACFEDITLKINGFLQDFEKEKEAKVEFDKIQNGITNSTYQAEKQFANLKNSLPNYQNTYKINSTYLEQIVAMQDLIDDMSSSKRRLDSYINSSTKQPYSLLINYTYELNKKISKIQAAFDDFHEYLGKMKTDTDRAYKLVREGYLKIKEKEYILRELNISSLTEILLPKLNKCYEDLVKIDEVLNVTPIDVSNLNNIYAETKKELESVVNRVDEEKENATKAENLIAYCNKYRADSYDVKVGLESAESSFLEADFHRAQARAAQIYKEQTSIK
jgi:septation ring formation regulator EzrA